MKTPSAIFGGDGLAHAVWHDGSVVDTTGELIEALAIAAEVIFKRGEFQGIEITNRCDSNCLHAALCDLSYSRMRPTGSGRRKLCTSCG